MPPIDVALFQIVLIVGVGASTVLYLIGIYSGFEFFGRRRQPYGGPLPPVTVLKPLKGKDVELFENLRTLCEQDYRRFQIVFGVADGHDPAVEVVHELQRLYPRLDIELVVDRRVYGTNYKVSNLHNTLQRAKHDIIVLADSDIRVRPGYLRSLVAELQEPGVGLVTVPYRALGRDRLPTLVESLFINTDFAALVMLARKIERPTYAFGATIAIRRDMLERIGGFLPIADHLADDYQLGNKVAALGYELRLCNEVVDTVISLGGWRRLLDHQLRWARTYRISRPGGYFGSLLAHGTFWALLNVLYHGFSPASLLASGLAVGVRTLSAALFTWRFLATDMPARQLVWLLPKDLFVTLCWFLAFLSNTVVWSNRRFRVLSDGRMVDLSPAAPRPVRPESENVPQARTGTNGR